jgi:hypothetical protein
VSALGTQNAVILSAGLLRDSVMLRGASSCQLQRASLGKLLNLQISFSNSWTHNAGVEGSSPSLSTNNLSHLERSSRPHDRECGRFAGGDR